MLEQEESYTQIIFTAQQAWAGRIKRLFHKNVL